MASTAVGLFANQSAADAAARELEAQGFASGDVHILSEPLGMAVADETSTPHTDFEVSLRAELRQIGATEPEADAYVEGVRRHRALVFVTGTDEKARSAVDVMTGLGAMEVERLSGGELHAPAAVAGASTPKHDRDLQLGRSQHSSRVRVFRW
ncbi:MAG: hypothetical protein ACRD10_01385 [Terriglobia bacterium]